MNSAKNESGLSWLLSIGSVSVTLLVTSNFNYDPVNVSKLLLLSAVAFSGLAVVFYSREFNKLGQDKLLASSILLFLLFSFSTLLLSSAPATRNFYGAFGRNTGFLAYFALVVMMSCSALLVQKNSFNRIINGLLLAGVINVIYCALVLSGYDLLKWNNIYGKILGTFGNPDFISAFLGIFVVGIISYTFYNNKNLWVVVVNVTLALIGLYEIRQSHAIQGLAVAATGFSIIGFYLVRSVFAKNFYTIIYISVIGVIGSFAVAGAFQRGPLTEVIYKTSVSLRGVYWDAGIKMGLEHPLTGVGFDGYGDWYRTVRSAKAIQMPGTDTVTNAAHNVVIDMFATGGFPLLLAYLFMLGLALRAVFRFTLRNRKYDPIFVSLATMWFSYQIQSIVSINQIGLAIWGWVLTGSVIAYEKSTRVSNRADEPVASEKNRNKRKIGMQTRDKFILPAVFGFVIGLAIAMPPFIADGNWRSSLEKQDGLAIEKAANAWPLETFRMNNFVVMLDQNNYKDKALQLSKKSTSFNPHQYDSWKILSQLSGATESDKTLAFKMMKELDPRNPEFK